MKNFVIKSAKIVGTASQNAWSQIHLFSPNEAKKIKHRGQLLAVLSLSGLNKKVEATAVGREIISRLHEEYYGNLEDKAFKRLRRAVIKVCQEANDETQVEIIAAAVLGPVVYLVVFGQGQVALHRQDQTGLILKGGDQAAITSGYLQAGDLYLLGTANFFSSIAAEALKAALASGSPTEAAETLAPIVHGQTNSSTTTALLFKTINQPTPPPTTDSQKPIDSTSAPTEKSHLRLKIFQALLTQQLKKIKIFFGQLSGQFSEKFQKRLRKKAVFLKKEKRQPRSKKTVFSVVLILLVMLAVSVVLGKQQRQHQGDQVKAAELYRQALQKKEEGESLLTLNPASSRELLLEAQALATQAEASQLKNDEFEEFKKQLTSLLDQVIKERQAKTELLLDLGMIKQGAKGDDLAFSGGKLIILDKEKQSLYEISPEDRKSSILAGGQKLAGSLHVTAFLPNVYVLAQDGLLVTNRLTKKTKLVINADDQWDQIVGLDTFNNNLYLLDQNNQIWQYPVAETGFGQKRNWLKTSQIDFSNASDIAIDGSIWVLKTDGQILKFTRGSKDPFGVSGLDKPLANPIALYTDDDSENLYLFDQGNNRIVILDKSGELKKSYLINLEGVSDLVVSEENSKAFLLSGSNVYIVDL